MRRSTFLTGLVSIILFAFVGGTTMPAWGQTHFPSEQNIVMGDWVFTPVLAETGGVRSVAAFLALRDTATLAGANIGSVLYARGAGFAGGWGSLGWATQDQWSAIEWVKDAYAIPSAFDELWQTTQAAPTVPAAPVEPEAFDNGVLESDPLAPAATPSPEWQAVVAMLVDAGWAAADLPTEQPSGEINCPNDPVVGVMAGIVEAVEGGADLEESVQEAWTDFLGCLGFCLPVMHYGTATAPECGAPGPYGAPVLHTPNNFVFCKYTRTRTCTQNRVVVVLRWDCTIALCFQGRSRVESEEMECNFTGMLYPSGNCPTTPCNGVNQGQVFEPTSVGAWTGWTPACP